MDSPQSQAISIPLPEPLKAGDTELIERLLVAGVDDSQIPFILGHNERFSLIQWANRNPAINKLIVDARERMLNRVENAMVGLALGGVLRTRVITDTGAIIIKEQEVAPSFQAQKYVLENHRPQTWRPTPQKLEHSFDEMFGDDQKVAKADEHRFRRVFGRILESGAGECGSELSVPAESERDSVRQQGCQADVLADDATISDAGVQDPVLDIQSEDGNRMPERPVHNLAGPGSSD